MPYETQSKWTIDELKKLNKATLIGMHKPYLAFVIALEVLFAGGIIVSAAISSAKLMAEFAALLIILPLSLYLITNIRIKKEYNSNKILQTTVTTFRFDEDKLESSSDRGSAFVKYDEIYKILETDTNFYLFLSKNQALNVIKANCSDELISFLHNKKSEA
ncbi:YcxB family protein [Butyrivibrio proteoclasticus]|uniref:YcxB family protein n=1 Tax=Butyrivibrio proteoclasticus TaxID=43305 RepID=UPI00047BCFC2|nr:YcxB family protein [Butyrivibrio proteoclasticus]